MPLGSSGVHAHLVTLVAEYDDLVRSMCAQNHHLLKTIQGYARALRLEVVNGAIKRAMVEEGVATDWASIETLHSSLLRTGTHCLRLTLHDLTVSYGTCANMRLSMMPSFLRCGPG